MTSSARATRRIERGARLASGALRSKLRLDAPWKGGTQRPKLRLDAPKDRAAVHGSALAP